MDEWNYFYVSAEFNNGVTICIHTESKEEASEFQEKYEISVLNPDILTYSMRMERRTDG